MPQSLIEVNRRDLFKGALSLTATASLAPRSFASKSASQSPAAPKIELNVRDFGAKGDGITLETDTLQRILDRCHVLGGGQIIVPAGRYLTGGLTLRSNVTLRLEKDATLVGSPNLSDYKVSEVRWEGKMDSGLHSSSSCLRRSKHRCYW